MVLAAPVDILDTQPDAVDIVGCIHHRHDDGVNGDGVVRHHLDCCCYLAADIRFAVECLSRRAVHTRICDAIAGEAAPRAIESCGRGGLNEATIAQR